MSNITNIDFSEELLEKAAIYLTIMDDRSLSGLELIEFKAWLLESDENRLAFEQVASVWGKMDVLQGLAEIFPIDEISTDHQAKTRTYLTGAIAACVIFIGGLLSLYSSFWDAPLEQNSVGQTYITQVGETEVITMAEGSKVLANTDSQLSVLVTETQRRVILDKGEAFFEVKHDPERTFDVIVGDTIVRAVGTAFSVYRNGSDLEVIVTEGIVEVIRNTPTSESTTSTEMLTPISRLLHPGEVATFAASNNAVTNIEQDELARKLIWRQGMLAFEGEPLEKVIEEFNRYNKITLEIDSDEIRNMRVGGYFNSNDVAGMLTALQDNFGVEVTHISYDHVVLTASK